MLRGMQYLELYLIPLLSLHVTLWDPVGGERQCPNKTLSILAFVPCRPEESVFRDSLVYSAAQLAADHLNDYSSLLADVAVKITPLNGRDVSPSVRTA